MRRTQQFDLYAAEARSNLGPVVADPQAWIDQVVGQPWFSETYNIPFVEVQVVQNRPGGSCGGIDQTDGAGIMEMSSVHCQEHYLLHELAHVTARDRYGSRSHDPWFARELLELTYRVRGPRAWLRLKAIFAGAGICYDERSV